MSQRLGKLCQWRLLCLLRSADQVRAAQAPTVTAVAAGVESMRCCHCTAVMFAVALAWEVASDIGERFAVAWRCWLLVATRHMATGDASEWGIISPFLQVALFRAAI